MECMLAGNAYMEGSGREFPSEYQDVIERAMRFALGGLVDLV